jgi:hypothetical protein
VLVTGGTGYVGCHTVAAQAGQGHQVRLLVRARDRIGPALDPLGVAGAGRSSRPGPANPPAAALLPAFSNAGLSDFPVWCRASAIGGPRAQRVTNLAAHPGCFASFPVRTIRVSEVRDRPNGRRNGSWNGGAAEFQCNQRLAGPLTERDEQLAARLGQLPARF